VGDDVTTIDQLSRLENDSIRAWVKAYPWTGDVLDYGCGRRPYADLIKKAGATYHGWDRDTQGGGSVGNFGPDDPLTDTEWDAILCTQVVEYVPNVYYLLRQMREALAFGGALVLTYPTVWPELPYDLHRFTRLGMDRLLTNAGFVVERHECRAVLPGVEVRLPLGYGVVARAAHP
jgi:SAM-dependent methyltransferase